VKEYEQAKQDGTYKASQPFNERPDKRYSRKDSGQAGMTNKQNVLTFFIMSQHNILGLPIKMPDTPY
jgi:hypothetical protein